MNKKLLFVLLAFALLLFAGFAIFYDKSSEKNNDSVSASSQKKSSSSRSAIRGKENDIVSTNVESENVSTKSDSEVFLEELDRLENDNGSVKLFKSFSLWLKSDPVSALAALDDIKIEKIKYILIMQNLDLCERYPLEVFGHVQSLSNPQYKRYLQNQFISILTIHSADNAVDIIVNHVSPGPEKNLMLQNFCAVISRADIGAAISSLTKLQNAEDLTLAQQTITEEVIYNNPENLKILIAKKIPKQLLIDGISKYLGESVSDRNDYPAWFDELPHEYRNGVLSSLDQQ